MAHSININRIYTSLELLMRCAGLDMVERSALASIRKKAVKGTLDNRPQTVLGISAAARHNKAARQALLCQQPIVDQVAFQNH